MAFELLDLLSLRFLRLFRVGPWYCNQCETKSYFLKFRRWYRPTKRDYSEFDDEDSAGSGSKFESSGNYIKSGSSLLMHKHRSSRYSQKFKDATVLRVLSREFSIAQIRQELGLTDMDLVLWIAEFVERKDRRIDELTQRIQSLQGRVPLELRPLLEERTEQSLDQTAGDVVDGRIVPK
jgi:transposase-like protein